MNFVIKVENLKKQFGELSAVAGLNFEIHQNEILGLLGPNGAGKTTTINMICGLLPPTSGTIHFNGSNGKDHKSRIGYCPQENIFYPKLNCLEQLIFIGQMHGLTAQYLKTTAMELLELLGLKEKAHVRAANLSGGMKRRLNICLALVHDPEIIILDEPEAGLDPQSRILVREFIKTLGKEKTVILTTHNIDEADRLADRIAIIDHGKLLLLDTPQNLKKTIGEGDILELVITNGDDSMINQFSDQIQKLKMVIKSGSNAILIKHPDIIQHLSKIKDIAYNNGLNIAEIKLRENTLEDVFIHLTGRNLRE